MNDDIDSCYDDELDEFGSVDDYDDEDDGNSAESEYDRGN